MGGDGRNLPTRLVGLEPLTCDLSFEGNRFELRGGPAALPDRHYLWQAERRAILGGVLLFQREHVWVADTPTPGDRSAWIGLLHEMAKGRGFELSEGGSLPNSRVVRTERYWSGLGFVSARRTGGQTSTSYE